MNRKVKSMLLTATSFISGGILGVMATIKFNEKALNSARCLSDKHLKMMHVLNQWLANQQAGVDISEYFTDNNYRTIAVYGMSYLGERLVTALRKTEIEVKYCIDKRAENMFDTNVVKSVDSNLPKVDVIVVTAVYFFNEIENELSDKVDCPIISLEDVVKRV